jgi:hypothetical protein
MIRVTSWWDTASGRNVGSVLAYGGTRDPAGVYLFLFLGFVGLQAVHHVVKVDLMPIELGAIDTDKLDLSPDINPATTAHARAIHHDRVEGHDGVHAVGLRGAGAEFHHDRWSDRNNKVRRCGALTELLQGFRDECLDPCGPIIGADDQLIGDRCHFLVHDHQLLIASTDDHGEVIPGSFHGLGDGERGGDSDAPAHNHHTTHLFDVSGLTQRTYQVGDVVPFVHFGQGAGRLTHTLENERDAAFFLIRVGDGQGDAFAILVVDLQDDELASLAFLGDQRCVNAELENIR